MAAIKKLVGCYRVACSSNTGAFTPRSLPTGIPLVEPVQTRHISTCIGVRSFDQQPNQRTNFPTIWNRNYCRLSAPCLPGHSTTFNLPHTTFSSRSAQCLLIQYRHLSSDNRNDDKSRVYLKLMNMREIVWPHLLKSVRNRFFKFLITNFYDKSFSQTNFLSGAEQATKVVSSLISDAKWNELKHLVTDDAVSEIKDNYSKLSAKQRRSIAVDPQDFFLRFVYEIGMMFDDTTNQRYVEITVVFQGLHGLHKMREDDPENYFQEIPARQEDIFICNYRFIREFTRGVEDDWTINGLNHFSPKEVVSMTPPFSR